MSDLAAFLTARLDEDEAAARAASRGPWKLQSSASDPYWNGRNWEFGENVSAQHGAGIRWGIWTARGDSVMTCSDGDERPMADLAHIARHDPARVLREVEGLRAIVESHTGTHECPEADDNCGWLEGRDCLVLTRLGTIWSDHPDYDAAWA